MMTPIENRNRYIHTRTMVHVKLPRTTSRVQPHTILHSLGGLRTVCDPSSSPVKIFLNTQLVKVEAFQLQSQVRGSWNSPPLPLLDALQQSICADQSIGERKKKRPMWKVTPVGKVFFGRRTDNLAP